MGEINKIHNIKDLIGKTIVIYQITEGSVSLICAKDMNTGALFVLEEIINPKFADKNT